VLALVDGKLAFLPGGVDEYLELRQSRALEAGSQNRAAVPGRAGTAPGTAAPGTARPGTAAPGTGAPGAAARQRVSQKELARLERQIGKLTETEASLGEELARSASDYERLIELGAQLKAAQEERAALEDRWLVLADELG
jgi:ATP-binding cassette subfamily F protein uup